jgi:RNA polymerase sigma-70 factor (ECF subfamily)
VVLAVNEMKANRQELLWVVRAQAGDTEALDALLRSIQDPLHRYLVRLVGDHHLANDVLQDVFVILVRKLYWLREPSVFRAWVYRIASRQAMHLLQREKRVGAHPTDHDVLTTVAEEVHETFAEPELLQRLPDLLQELSPASRAVLSLHYLESMTLQEVADVLEITLAATKSRLAYGLSVLRKRLQPRVT